MLVTRHATSKWSTELVFRFITFLLLSSINSDSATCSNAEAFDRLFVFDSTRLVQDHDRFIIFKLTSMQIRVGVAEIVTHRHNIAKGIPVKRIFENTR